MRMVLTLDQFPEGILSQNRDYQPAGAPKGPTRK
jgi:hypothetical protein